MTSTTYTCQLFSVYKECSVKGVVEDYIMMKVRVNGKVGKKQEWKKFVVLLP